MHISFQPITFALHKNKTVMKTLNDLQQGDFALLLATEKEIQIVSLDGDFAELRYPSQLNGKTFILSKDHEVEQLSSLF